MVILEHGLFVTRLRLLACEYSRRHFVGIMNHLEAVLYQIQAERYTKKIDVYDLPMSTYFTRDCLGPLTLRLCEVVLLAALERSRKLEID